METDARYYYYLFQNSETLILLVKWKTDKLHGENILISASIFLCPHFAFKWFTPMRKMTIVLALVSYEEIPVEYA